MVAYEKSGQTQFRRERMVFGAHDCKQSQDLPIRFECAMVRRSRRAAAPNQPLCGSIFSRLGARAHRSYQTGQPGAAGGGAHLPSRCGKVLGKEAGPVECRMMPCPPVAKAVSVA